MAKGFRKGDLGKLHARRLAKFCGLINMRLFAPAAWEPCQTRVNSQPATTFSKDFFDSLKQGDISIRI